MNREILFIGKVKDGYKWIVKGEWVEGSLFYSDDENGTTCQIATSYLSSNKDEPVMAVAYEVEPETVCQYTGLTDKNGRKIFEGDIVKVTDNDRENQVFGIGDISFGEGSWKLCGEILYWLDDVISFELEVIGNIFDNPELLKE